MLCDLKFLFLCWQSMCILDWMQVKYAWKIGRVACLHVLSPTTVKAAIEHCPSAILPNHRARTVHQHSILVEVWACTPHLDSPPVNLASASTGKTFAGKALVCMMKCAAAWNECNPGSTNQAKPHAAVVAYAWTASALHKPYTVSDLLAGSDCKGHGKCIMSG